MAAVALGSVPNERRDDASGRGTRDRGRHMAAGSIWSSADAGGLAGNWSWTVWLLIPLVLVLAYVTARCVGRDGDPPRARASRHGVGEYLDRHLAEQDER